MWMEDLRMPDDQDGCMTLRTISPPRIVQRQRDLCSSFWIRCILIFMTIFSFLLIAIHAIFYTYYFHVWNGSLIEFDQNYPNTVDLEFFYKVISIMIPVEAWLMTSAVGVVVGIVEIILRKVGISARRRLLVAISSSVASLLFGVFHFGFYNFHQFALKTILSYQIDDTKIDQLFGQVTKKLWET